MGAAGPGISHVLTGRVMEFIMEALEKLNRDYGQLPPPRPNASCGNSALGSPAPIRSLVRWPCRVKAVTPSALTCSPPHRAMAAPHGVLGCRNQVCPGQHHAPSRGSGSPTEMNLHLQPSQFCPLSVGEASSSPWRVRRRGLNLGESSELCLNSRKELHPPFTL